MDVFAYIATLGLTFSDWLLMACVIPIGYFIWVYGFLTKWWEDIFGWIILSGALGLFFVIVSIIWSVFSGARIDEPVRVILYGAIFLSWCGKDVILTNERHLGKLEKLHPRIPTGKDTL